MVVDAVRKLTEKWKQCPLLLFISFSVIGIGIAVGLCASTIVSRKKRIRDEGGLAGEENGSGWGAIKKVLMGSVCWSGRSSWSEREREGVDLQKMPAFLAGCRDVEWNGVSSPVSPLWQRRILMGERCKLPKFSGLILYDERGHPLRHSNKTSSHQEKPTTAVTTTLRDLL